MNPYWFTLVSGKIQKATKKSAAFDLFYNGMEPLAIGDSPVAVPTGVRSMFHEGLVAIIKEKSGLALKGLEVKGGVIDADYRDEWKVILRMPIQVALPAFQDGYGYCIPEAKDYAPHIIYPGDKIAQFLLVALPNINFNVQSVGAEISFVDELRMGGFGSTGK